MVMNRYCRISFSEQVRRLPRAREIALLAGARDKKRATTTVLSILALIFVVTADLLRLRDDECWCFVYIILLHVRTTDVGLC